MKLINKISDGFNYLFFENILCKSIITTGSELAVNVAIRMMPIPSNTKSKFGTKTAIVTTHLMSTNLPLWRLSGLNLWVIRLAGLSGATAIVLSVYGSDRIYDEENGESKIIFEIASKYHFFHSITMVAVPLCSNPLLTGLLMAMGTVLFTGPCYYRAFTGNNQYSKMAPFGVCCLVLAWLSLML